MVGMKRCCGPGGWLDLGRPGVGLMVSEVICWVYSTICRVYLPIYWWQLQEKWVSKNQSVGILCSLFLLIGFFEFLIEWACAIGFREYLFFLIGEWPVKPRYSKKSPTGPTERTPKPEYLIVLATYLGVRWDSVPFNFWWSYSFIT